MPGGIGRVSETMVSAGTQQDRVIATVKNANEIFYNLDIRRVYFDRAEGQLYFVDAPSVSVWKTIAAALGRERDSVVIEQLHLDTHKFFNGARRVRLGSAQADAVLVALRIAGVHATVR